MAFIYPLGLTDTDFADGDTGPGYAPQTYIYGSHIVIPSTGTVTVLSVRGYSGGATLTIKLALYNDDGDLAGNTTASMPNAATDWRDSGAVSIPVTAGTYYLMASAEGVDARYTYSTDGNGSYATQAYASFPVDPETISEQAETGQLFAVRADFTAGGGSTSHIYAAYSSMLGAN